MKQVVITHRRALVVDSQGCLKEEVGIVPQSMIDEGIIRGLHPGRRVHLWLSFDPESVIWDLSKLDGQRRRCLDTGPSAALRTGKSERLFGFRAKTTFEEGLRRMVDWYQTQRMQKMAQESARGA